MGSIPIARSTLRLSQTTSDNSPKPKSMVAWKILGFGVELVASGFNGQLVGTARPRRAQFMRYYLIENREKRSPAFVWLLSH